MKIAHHNSIRLIKDLNDTSFVTLLSPLLDYNILLKSTEMNSLQLLLYQYLEVTKAKQNRNNRMFTVIKKTKAT